MAFFEQFWEEAPDSWTTKMIGGGEKQFLIICV